MSRSGQTAGDTSALVIESGVVGQEVDEETAKVHFLDLLRAVLALKEGDDHQEKGVGAQTSEVGVIEVADLKELLQDKDERLYHFVLGQEVLH